MYMMNVWQSWKPSQRADNFTRKAAIRPAREASSRVA